MSEEKNLAKIIPARLIRLFERTPRKHHFRIRVVVAGHRESLELVDLAGPLDRLMERGPERMLKLVMEGRVDEKEAMAHYRTIRDDLHKLRQDMETLASLVGMNGLLEERHPRSRSRGAERTSPPPAPALGAVEGAPSEDADVPAGEAESAEAA